MAQDPPNTRTLMFCSEPSSLATIMSHVMTVRLRRRVFRRLWATQALVVPELSRIVSPSRTKAAAA